MSVLGFHHVQVGDLAAVVTVLRTAGASVTDDDGELRPAYVRAQTTDPAGNRLELVQRVPGQ